MTTKKADPHQGWVASLSNGETVLEWKTEPGERSAWGQLKERCAEEGLYLTQIQLQIDGRTWVGLRDADGYCFFRDYRQEGIFSGNLRAKHHAGIGSVDKETVYCTVVDSQNQAQQDSRPLASMRAHCVLKPAGQLKMEKARKFLEEQEKLLNEDLAGRFSGVKKK
jgi:hypothetical protein